MSEKNTIARPYAQAIFELAGDRGDITQWSQNLEFLALLVRDPQIQDLLSNPRLTERQLSELFLHICAESLDEYAKNFVLLLAEKRRFAVLPEIAELYEEMRRDSEGVVRGEMVSAFEVSTEQRRQIAAALKVRLGRDVELECIVDESLIGGAVVRAGDLVIDGSVQGKLFRLANALSH